MQQALSKRGMVLLTAFLAVCAMAFALVTAQPAMADDDLVAGEPELAAQSGDATAWPFRVYVQYGEDKKLIASYTRDELDKLAPTKASPVSGLHYENNAWYVTTAVSYVTLEDLLEDAGVYWASGATLEYSNDEESLSFTFDKIEDLNFYPSAPDKKVTDAEPTGLVFGLKNVQGAIIGDGSTAAEVQKVAEASAVTDASVLAVMGSTEEDFKTLTGTTVNKHRFIVGVNSITVVYPEGSEIMYRLYNPNSGEHFYTASELEKDTLSKIGWTYEGTGWIAPKLSNSPVYRLYNPNAGDHHYTMSLTEKNALVAIGWKYEGVGWCSDDNKSVELLRLYNPNAEEAGAHHYTTSAYERDQLVKEGWTFEGTAWYGLSS